MTTRREKVILELEDRFTAPTLKAAAAAAMLNRELHSLDGTSVRTGRSTSGLNDGIAKTGESARRASSDLNQYTGRLGLLATAAATIGPALLPIGATALPAVTALAGGLGATAGAVGTAVLAFHGLGDGLKALNDYQLDPTEAHFEKLQQQMSKLSPAARALVQRLDELGPVVTRLQRTAQHGMFPGVNEGLTEILTLTPEVTRIVEQLSLTMGRLATDTGAALKNDGDWQAFFHFIETDAGPTLDAFARATGNVVAGLGSMLVAFAPLSRDFSAGMLEMSRDFRQWAASLSETDGFQSFVDYIRESGPQVASFLGAIGSALVGLAQAAAPWGSMVLPILTDVAKVFGALGSSPIGPMLFTAAAGMLAITRGAAGLSAVTTGLGNLALNSEKAGKGLNSLAAKTGAIILLGQALGALANSFNTGNAINMGDLGRDVQKIADGGTTSSLKRLAESLEDVNERGAGTVNALFALPSALTGVQTSFEQGKSTIDAFDQQLAQLVESGQADKAAELFERIRAAAAAHGGVSDEDVVKRFDSYRTALDNAKGSLHQTATASEHLALSQARAEERAKALEKAMNEQRKVARTTADSFLQFGDSLGDTEVSLGRWIRSMEKQAQALRNFTRNAQTAARRGLREGLIAELEAAGPAGALRMRQLANASDKEIARANRAWASGRQAIREYVAMKVPPKILDVRVDPGAAGRIQWVKEQIAGIHDKTVQVTAYTHLVNLPGKLAGMKADRDFADGGYTGRGGKYEPAGIVHRGEFVFSADATRGHERDLAMLQKRLRGYAGGGVVGDPRGQLFGLGTKRFSDAEIGGRIANLTVRQILQLGAAMDDLSKRNLKHLGNALDKATEAQQKQVDATKKALEDVQSKRSSLAGTVTSGLTRNLWESHGGGVFSSRYTAGSIGAANEQLRAQIRDSRDFARLEGILANRGVSGAALQNLLAEGGIDALRMAASSSAADLRTYHSLYGTAQADAVRAGRGAGTLVYGAAEARAQAAYDKQSAEIRAIQHEIRLLRQEEKQRDLARAAREARNADRTGRAVAAAHDKTAKNARRG